MSDLTNGASSRCLVHGQDDDGFQRVANTNLGVHGFAFVPPFSLLLDNIQRQKDVIDAMQTNSQVAQLRAS